MDRCDTSRPDKQYYRELTARDLRAPYEPTPQRCRLCGVGPENTKGWLARTLCRPCGESELAKMEVQR